jgi:hypothetical protein
VQCILETSLIIGKFKGEPLCLKPISLQFSYEITLNSTTFGAVLEITTPMCASNMPQ